MDTRGLVTRSRAAIARFEKAHADGNPGELAEARKALEICHAEVGLVVAAHKAMKSEKLEATVQKIATSSAPERRSRDGLRLAHWGDSRTRDLTPRLDAAGPSPWRPAWRADEEGEDVRQSVRGADPHR
jgi:hypothetical protein